MAPFVAPEIMELHHKKHHATYVANYNATMEKVLDAQAKGDVSGQLSLQGALKFNGGGHVNHSIFWSNLAPVAKGGGDVDKMGADLKAAVARDFGSVDALKARLAASSVGVQGSGWGWLGYDPADKRLRVATCPNQDPLHATTGLVPLLGIDVCEHSYYLQYKNVRPDYVNALWGVVNWADVSARFDAAARK